MKQTKPEDLEQGPHQGHADALVLFLAAAPSSQGQPLPAGRD